MKIKFFNLFLALVFSSSVWAASAPMTSQAFVEDGMQLAVFNFGIDAGLVQSEKHTGEESFSLWEVREEDELTCEITIKVKIGNDKFGSMEGSVTVKGDCKEIIEEAKKKLADLKDMVGK